MEKKDFYQKLGVIEKVLDKNMFESLYYSEPFVCKLILDKFKSCLDDEQFDSLERQLILLKFLKNNYPLELSRDVIEFACNSKFSQDYTRVIMEWNYDSSDYIKQYSLLEYDAAPMALDKETKRNIDNQKHIITNGIDLATEITAMFLQDKQGKSNDEEN